MMNVRAARVARLFSNENRSKAGSRFSVWSVQLKSKKQHFIETAGLWQHFCVHIDDQLSASGVTATASEILDLFSFSEILY